MDTQDTVVLFCANEQAETPHVLDIDGMGEILLTCGCGRCIKLPADTDAAGIKAYAEAHKLGNEGQISVASIEAKKAELLAALGSGDLDGTQSV